MVDTWRKFWSRSAVERGIVLEAAAGLTATWLGLRLAGFRRWKYALDWLAPTNPLGFAEGDPSLVASARATARAEEAAARHLFFRTNCLEQSLVLWWLLRRRGIAADVRIGARKEGNCFEAHAWVEINGAVLNDTGEDHLHFVPFEGPITPMETQTH
jgi:hypothetical protein